MQCPKCGSFLTRFDEDPGWRCLECKHAVSEAEVAAMPRAQFDAMRGKRNPLDDMPTLKSRGIDQKRDIAEAKLGVMVATWAHEHDLTPTQTLCALARLVGTWGKRAN